jgi:hypothetical protein
MKPKRNTAGWKAWPRGFHPLRCSVDSAEFTLSEWTESNPESFRAQNDCV